MLFYESDKLIFSDIIVLDLLSENKDEFPIFLI